MTNYERELMAQRIEARNLAKEILPMFQGKTIEFCEETLSFVRFKLEEAHKKTPIHISSEND